jgi:hypothetical protein
LANEVGALSSGPAGEHFDFLPALHRHMREFVVDKKAETGRVGFPRWRGRTKQRLFFWQG